MRLQNANMTKKQYFFHSDVFEVFERNLMKHENSFNCKCNEKAIFFSR